MGKLAKQPDNWYKSKNSFIGFLFGFTKIRTTWKRARKGAQSFAEGSTEFHGANTEGREHGVSRRKIKSEHGVSRRIVKLGTRNSERSEKAVCLSPMATPWVIVDA